jgi:hypothetical protein
MFSAQMNGETFSPNAKLAPMAEFCIDNQR